MRPALRFEGSNSLNLIFALFKKLFARLKSAFGGLPGESFKVPKTAQDTIPVSRITGDGIFHHKGYYSKSWRFQDINYCVSSDDAQLDMFMDYSAIINSLDTDATTKITTNNRTLDGKALERSLFLSHKDDGLNGFRDDYNGIIYANTAGSHNTAQDKYVTVTTARRSVEEARTFFKRISLDMEKGFACLGSKATSLSINERLEILHDFFRAGTHCSVLT